MPSQNGYNSIPENDEQQAQQGEQLPSTVISRIKQFDYKTYARKHRLPVVVSTVIALFIILLMGLATWLPDIKHKETTHLIQPPITPGISSSAFKQGLAKCQQIHSHYKASYTNTQKRTLNPRAPQDIQPIVLRNAVIWDGQGEILNHVDILMSNGVISQVKQNIQAPVSAKIIDVGGHIVSPGIVDMHTYVRFERTA